MAIYANYLSVFQRNERGIDENSGLMVKCTPERGHNALFFIPLEVIIML